MGCNSFKRITVFLLLVTMLIALCACGLGGNTPNDEKTPTTLESVTTPSAAAPEAAAPSGPEVSPDATYLEAFLSVLLDNAEYYDGDRKVAAKLSEERISTEELKRAVTDFTVIDLDNDGTPEVILWISINSTCAFKILRYQNDTVCGYDLPLRGFMDLKTDGTFSYSGGAADNGYGRIEFSRDSYSVEKITYCQSVFDYDNEQDISFTVNHVIVTQDDFYAAIDTQTSKTDVAWFEFSVDNIKAMLTLGDYKYKENSDGTVTIFRYVGLGGDIAIPPEIDGKKVTAIGNTFGTIGAFKDCAALTSVIIPDGVTEIQDNAFYSCTSLASVTIPASVTLLRNCAFADCPSLRSVYFEGDAPQVANYVFTESLYLVFYHQEGTSGWTNPWHSRPTAVTDSNIETISAEEKALTAYSEFIEGNISLSEDDMAKISIQGENPMSNPNGYAILDMNGDGIPELLIRSDNIYILTYKDGSLSLLWSDCFWAGYSLILNNGTVLHIRDGAAPTHTNYQYLILDKDGTVKEQIGFEKYDSDENGIYDYFVFEGEDELSEDEWNQETQPYLSIKEIEWKEDLT